MREVRRDVGIGMAVVIAANRTRHPLDARTLARLAAQYAGRGVVGFGLSNDERRGSTRDFAPAFRIAERAGLLLVPHGGELLGPDSVRLCVEELHAGRLGHGIRAAEDPDLLDLIVSRGIALEVCPVSNVALGVYSDLSSVPLPELMAAGATIALGADDPLLFGSQLAGQYATMRAAHELTDDQLADLARSSIRASRAPEEDKWRWLGEIDDWLGHEPMTTYPGETRGRPTSSRTRGSPRDTPGRTDPGPTEDQPRRSGRPSRPSRSATGSAGSEQAAEQARAQGAAQRTTPTRRAGRCSTRRPDPVRPALPQTRSVRPGPTASPLSGQPYSSSPSRYAGPYGQPYGQAAAATRPGRPVGTAARNTPGYPPYGAYAPPRPDHPQSTLALILGIVGLVGAFMFCGLRLVVSPFAWALGRNALKDIRASQGRIGGEGQARAGMIMGIVGTVLADPRA